MGCNNCDGVELPIGPAGSQGPQGIQGEIGPQGDPGADGSIGLTGATGPAGADGINGIDGLDGADGDDGILFQSHPIPGNSASTTGYFEITATSVANAYSFIYPGTTNDKTPTRIKLVAYGSDVATQGSITITDMTHGPEWITPTLFSPGSTSAAIVDLGIPSNIDVDEALIRVTLEGVTVGQELTVMSLYIKY